MKRTLIATLSNEADHVVRWWDCFASHALAAQSRLPVKLERISNNSDLGKNTNAL